MSDDDESVDGVCLVWEMFIYSRFVVGHCILWVPLSGSQHDIVMDGWLDRKKKVSRPSISSSSSTYDSVMDGRPSTRVFVLGNPMIYVGREIDKLLVTIIQNCTLWRSLIVTGQNKKRRIILFLRDIDRFIIFVCRLP